MVNNSKTEKLSSNQCFYFSSASSTDFTGCSNSYNELWDFIEKGLGEGGGLIGVNRDKRELMSRSLLLDLTV